MSKAITIDQEQLDRLEAKLDFIIDLLMDEEEMELPDGYSLEDDSFNESVPESL